ncbi:hypothetical protein GUITHDRAFT_148798 [Guillardia theta CCMP2712]|uniref:Uncharacterized protein n=1 Tax=Guillardia theta (strain CCMP2712) TaxID=905079 RepID=L1I7T1_GUITC|nr:hypothetical protein GUITHDRAFT_148798 [Guillardia theta CCMP2712]EKX32157.1 hypothetical protein GUITHDRAFT_148798 [Guillardia theta CCMP2712]|eukprot:XP_005819137.1 hypothetical protein GUITHDRAFT_148798 [Guillardia theta CCMP2712]
MLKLSWEKTNYLERFESERSQLAENLKSLGELITYLKTELSNEGSNPQQINDIQKDIDQASQRLSNINQLYTTLQREEYSPERDALTPLWSRELHKLNKDFILVFKNKAQLQDRKTQAVPRRRPERSTQGLPDQTLVSEQAETVAGMKNLIDELNRVLSQVQNRPSLDFRSLRQIIESMKAWDRKTQEIQEEADRISTTVNRQYRRKTNLANTTGQFPCYACHQKTLAILKSISRILTP